jgi:hypothetical protein
MEDKHKSKLHLGFLKQVQRQMNKPDYTKKVVSPVILSWSCKHSEYRPLKQKFWNNKWNGMNLKNIYNSFTILRVGGMYGKFTINDNGKYRLSRYGKDLLRRKKLKKSTP